MQPDGWHLTEDLDDFLARAGDFLRSRPALHNTPLTVIEKLRTNGAAAHGAEAPYSADWNKGRGPRRLLPPPTPWPDPHPLAPRPLAPSMPTPSPPASPPSGTPSVRQRGPRHRHRLRRGMAPAHRYSAGTPHADPSLPPRHAHPTGAATGGPGPRRGRA
ncbi:hypothetical protein NKH18_28595 [Streptomyces sp. M10(2022)]